MCVTLFYDGQYIDSIGDLHAAIGQPCKTIAEFAERSHPLAVDECLCWVDMEATAKAIGKTARIGWNDAGVDWIID